MRSQIEIIDSLNDSALSKASNSSLKTLFNGIMAGIFVALAAVGANAAIYSIESPGPAKALSGAVFATALILVVFFSAELFTGNMLMVLPLTGRKTTVTKLAKNWFFVYIGNLLGSVLVAFLIVKSGQMDFGGAGFSLGSFTLKTAIDKVSLDFWPAFIRGILCNVMVCLGVWMAAASRSAAGKLIGIFFPIWAFVIAGYEHSVANMYYIPAGLFIKNKSVYLAGLQKYGMQAGAEEALTWLTFAYKNLLPVSLGNMVGGIFVGLAAAASRYFAGEKKNSD